MSAARDQHNVSWIRCGGRQRDGGFAIRLGAVSRPRALQPHDSVINDGKRIFAARIVRGQDYEIAAPSGSLAHQGALGPVPIAATAKNGDYLALLSRLLYEFPG